MREITLGQAMLQKILPPDVYQPGQELDKGAMRKILAAVAQKYPERYNDISFQLMQLGLEAGESTGGASFGWQDLRRAKSADERAQRIRKELGQIYRENLDPEVRKTLVTEYLTKEANQQVKDVYDESAAEGNRFALQLKGAGRGNKNSLAKLRGGAVLVQNAKGEPVPIPITRSFSQGLTPFQHFATMYGARSGIVGTKLSVSSSGYLSKLMQQAGHRVAVVDVDDPSPRGQRRGIPADVSDNDNIGALLAEDIGEFKRNDIITSRMLKKLREQGLEEILVRSPIASSHIEGGAYARDLGIREYGRLAQIGEHPGIIAGQTIGEKVTQSSLGAKHRAGNLSGEKATPGLSGFALSERLVNPSQSARGLAIHAEVDGRVEKIKAAPQGGFYITIAGTDHYVDPEFQPDVQEGDIVEAGDQLTDGIPNPATVTQHKGIGEGRLYFTKALRRGLQEAGFGVNRRQIETLATGLIDRVRVNTEQDEFLPGAIVPYSRIERLYRPRKDSEMSLAESAEGKYLEQPVLHYTIGTRVTPKVINRMRKFGVREIQVHKEPPFFEPQITRAIDLLRTDPDYMTRFLGSNLEDSLLKGVHFGAESDENSVSFVPSRASGVNFGKTPLQRGQAVREEAYSGL